MAIRTRHAATHAAALCGGRLDARFALARRHEPAAMPSVMSLLP